MINKQFLVSIVLFLSLIIIYAYQYKIGYKIPDDTFLQLGYGYFNELVPIHESIIRFH